MNPEEKANAHAEFFREFFLKVGTPIFQRAQDHLNTSNDAFSIVIKGHVIIEELVVLGIRKRVPQLDTIKKLLRDDFNARVAVLTALHSDTKGIAEIAECLRKLNKLRKDYAHSLDRDPIGEEEQLNEFVRMTMRSLNLDKPQSDATNNQVRECIVYLAMRIGSVIYNPLSLQIGPAKDIYGNQLGAGSP